MLAFQVAATLLLNSDYGIHLSGGWGDGQGIDGAGGGVRGAGGAGGGGVPHPAPPRGDVGGRRGPAGRASPARGAGDGGVDGGDVRGRGVRAPQLYHDAADDDGG